MASERIEALSRSLADGSSRRTLLALLGVGAAGTAFARAGLTETRAQNGETNPLENIRVRGKDEAGERVFRGRFTVEKFVVGEDQILAVGRLVGTLTQDGEKQRVRRQIEMPVELQSPSARQPACEILDLTLGPLDLRLLGLRVQLNRVHLRITAEPGGGLLGDLLCAIAGLLDDGATLRRIVRTLNRILEELQRL